MSQFCSKCGTKNLDEAMFCKNCGFNMQEAADLIQKEKSDKIKDGQKSADDKRREETARELNNYKKNVKGASPTIPHSDDNVQTKNNDGVKAFGSFIIFAIIVILIFRQMV